MRCWLPAVLLSTLLCACDGRRPQGETTSTPPAPPPPPVTTASVQASYTIAAGLERDYPEVVRFARRFLDTALAGDYAGYRRLVARIADPESRARFERILNAMDRLTIEAIDAVRFRPVSGNVYRVIGKVEFKPDAAVARRRGNMNRIAILVFEEEGQMRMMLAPAHLQPEDMTTTTSTAPTATQPSYPWEEDGNY